VYKGKIMGTYLSKFDLFDKMDDGQVDASEVLDLVDRYLNGEYPLDGLTRERLSLGEFYSSDWTIVSSKLNNPSNRSEAGFQVSFSKDGGRSTMVADFFSEGQSSQSAFKDDTSFDVEIKLSTGDSLEIDVETMFEGRDGVLMSSGFHEYPFTQNKEIYTINYKNTNGTSSLNDDVIINAKHNGSGSYSSSLETYLGKDSGSHYYKSELGLLDYTYGGSWEDSPSVSGGSGRGTYLADYEGFYIKYDYTQSGGETELFTFTKVKYDNDELVIELASHKFEAPEAPEGYYHYFDRYFEAESVGPLNPSLMKTVFEEDMLPLILGGNNVITGGSGDDFIDGGEGTDIAVYRGKLADYTFSKNESNLWVITDTKSNRDGTDTIQNIETLRFSDKKSVSVSSLTVTPIPGVVSIQAVYDDDAGAFGLYLTSNKALVIADSGLAQGNSTEDALTLLAANGKNFAFKPAANNSLLVDLSNPNPAKTFSIVYGKEKSWSQQFFDDEGIAVGRAGKLSYSDVLSLEVAFDKDITGEGDIGDAIVEVLISSEVGGVYKLESGAFAIGEIGLAEGDVPSSSVLLKSSATKSWTPGTADVLGLVDDAFGFKMILKSGARFSELTFNDQGIQQGKAQVLTNATLVQREKDLGVDLTGDGYAGFIQDSKAVASGTVETFYSGDSVYSIYSTPMTWAKANAYAKAVGGQLAVVEDIEENDFLYQEIMDLMSSSDLVKSTAKDGGGAAYVWLGATDAVTEGVWKWVNNQDLDTDNFMWGSNGSLSEPDDFGKKQDHLALGLEDWPVGDAGQWNDLNGSNKLFFVVEFEGAYSYS
jgi:Lectin C-type domain